MHIHCAIVLGLTLICNSQVLLIYTEGNTDLEYFRRVAREGVLPVLAEYHWLPTWCKGS